MRSPIFGTLIGFAVVLAPLYVGASELPEVVPGEYLVRYRDVGLSTNQVYQKLEKSANLKAAFKGMNVYHIAFKAGVNEQKSIEDIAADPDVAYIEPNYVLNKSQIEDTNSDPSAQDYTSQSGGSSYTQSTAPTRIVNAWGIESSIASKGKVIVAVVDTGLDSTHPVFRTVANGGTGALWVNQTEKNGIVGFDDDGNGFVDDISGWNFINNSANFYDDDEHGTHVAGIVVGTGTDIRAGSLTESPIQIMPLKFLDANGAGSTANAIKAIYYAVSNGARVINNSWGGGGYSRSLHEAFTYAYNYKVVLVSAAGNYTKNNDVTAMYPANLDVPSNISVAATTNSDALAYFSNYGASLVQIAAPGMDIVSTVPGGVFKQLSGTSMAAPFVAGLAALAIREAPNLSGYQVKNAIISSSDALNLLAGKVSSRGRANAFNLISSVKNMTLTASYQPGYSPDYSTLDLASSTTESKGKGGCGLVSSAAALRGPGQGGPTSPEALVMGLMALPLALWFMLRRKSPEQRRRHERFKINSEIKVKIGDRELVGAMNTISQGGLSFNVNEALEKGGIVTMKIASPDGHEMIEVQGAIVWSEQNQAYGVQFAGAREGALAMIRDWSQSLVKT